MPLSSTAHPGDLVLPFSHAIVSFNDWFRFRFAILIHNFIDAELYDFSGCAGLARLPVSPA